MINTTLLGSLISLTFLSIITPGPSNIMMMSSSALFGWRRTIPLYLGINFGSGVLVTASVFGLGAILETWPWLLLIAKLFGTLWLSLLSIKFFKNYGFFISERKLNFGLVQIMCWSLHSTYIHFVKNFLKT